jgi:hypothetical protein
MSLRAGTFSNEQVESANKLEISNGSAAFFAPEIVTEPDNGGLLVITNLSTDTLLSIYYVFVLRECSFISRVKQLLSFPLINRKRFYSDSVHSAVRNLFSQRTIN